MILPSGLIVTRGSKLASIRLREYSVRRISSEMSFEISRNPAALQEESLREVITTRVVNCSPFFRWRARVPWSLTCRRTGASKHRPGTRSLCRKHGFDRHGAAFQSPLDGDFLGSELGKFCFVSFKRVELLVRDKCVLHAVFHTHLGAFGGSFVLGHMRGAAHGVRDDADERLR